MSAAPVPTNVAVVARLRPLDPRDGDAPCLSASGEGGAAVVFSGAAGNNSTSGGNGNINSNINSNSSSAGASTLTFRLDHVHGPQSTQEDVFRHCEPLIDGVLKGMSGTIMAYGQTGSGKTHTLIGSIDGEGEEAPGPGAGIVPRACRLLLHRLEEQQQQAAKTATTTTTTPLITMTVVEIYAERVRCLLGGGQNLPLKQEPGGGAGSVRAKGAVEVNVLPAAAGSKQQQPLQNLQRALKRALQQRAVAATDLNSASSRSHCVVTLRAPCIAGAPKLCLVDLAGSERAGRTGAQGVGLAEGAAINKSLSTLAGVVSALAGGAGGGGGDDEPLQQQQQQQAPAGQPQSQQQQQHVPYRDSKLTRLLQDSLGGSARTVLLVCCSPVRRDGAETLSSLRFASRARGVKCLVAPAGSSAGGEAALLLAEVERLRQKVRELGGGGGGESGGKSGGGEGRGSGAGGASKKKPALQVLLPWLLRCASGVVLGAYLAWEGGQQHHGAAAW